MVDVVERVGPVPDRTAAAEVHVHADAASVAPVLVASLRALCGDALKVLSGAPRSSLFLFDRAPLAVCTPSGPTLLAFLSSCGAAYPAVEAWPAGDERVPLLLDRGALLCAGDRALVSEAVLERNQRAASDVELASLRERGWRPRSAEVVKALLAEGLRLPRRDILFVPTMPGDPCAHVCSWVVALDGVLIVPEIDQAAFDAIGLPHELALGRLVQTFLDVQAAELAARGFVVERLPMMPPTHLVRDAERGERWVGRWCSPTGGVLIEHGERRAALLPRPAAEDFPPTYRLVLEHALKAWRARYERAGYEVTFVDDGPVKARGGTLRQLVACFPSPAAARPVA